MSDLSDGAKDSSCTGSIVILESELNYAPWVHFLFRYLGPKYWRLLLTDSTTLMPHNAFVRTAQAGPSEGSRTPSSLALTPGASQSPNSSPSQPDNGQEDNSSKALFYLRSTLNDEAKYLIRNIESPSEAFQKLKLFYGKPRHQIMAERWARWVSLRYFRGHGASEFVRKFGQRLEEVEEISGIVDHRVVFGQFVNAISGHGHIPAFLEKSPQDFGDPNLMDAVCAEFLRHESSFSDPADSTVGFKFAPRPAINRQPDFWEQQYCPYHRRFVNHSHHRCRLGQSFGYALRNKILRQFESERRLYTNKRRRLDSCQDSCQDFNLETPTD